MNFRLSFSLKSALSFYTLTVYLVAGSFFNSFGQLQVSDTLNNNQLAELLVGSGVTINNVTVNCPSVAYGEFDGTNSNIGLPKGIMLTTGDINLAVGPNSIGMGGLDNFAPSTAYLDGLAGLNTFDACIFEFDVLPKGDTLRFPYVFGSEEYLEFVNIGFNDVFAFTIDGPNPAGGNYINQNIALIPGTTTPVTIDNVNNLLNAAYYFNNEIPPGLTVEYDGFTVNLVAKVPVTPCQSYHLRLQIADAGDGIYDSGVFVEKLTSPSVTFDFETEQGFAAAIEGCNNIILHFYQNFTNQDTTRITYQLAGTATPGVDYAPPPQEIQILPDSTHASIFVPVFPDTIIEGYETLVLRYFNNPCDSTSYDSIIVRIYDEVELQVSNDTTICVGTSIQLSALGGAVSYLWSPAASLDTPDIQFPVATPLATTTYMVQGIIGICPPDTGYITITALPQPIIDAGTDTTICKGNLIILPATSTDSIIAWTPGNVLNDDSILNPIANISATTTFTMNVSNGICGATDQITVTVEDSFSITVSPSPDTLVCAGDPIAVAVQGAWNYLWSPANVVTDSTASNTIASVGNTTTLTVVGMQSACPNDSASLIINMLPIPSISGLNDTTLCQGDVIMMGAVSSDTIISWSPSNGLSDSSILNPVVSVGATALYTLTISNGICQTSDSILITVIQMNPPEAGDDLDLCSRETAAIGDTTPTGFSYLWSPASGLDDPTSQNPLFTGLTNTGTGPVILTYNLIATDTNGCVKTDSVKITVLNEFTVDAGPDQEIVFGGSASLTGTGGVICEWRDMGADVFATTCQTLVSPTATTTYIFVGVNEIGCAQLDSVTINVVFGDALLVPSAFTPNGDGINDHLFAIVKGTYQLKSFQIFNRWGQKVFEANGTESDCEEPNITPVCAWDGTFKSKEQGQGTYIYYLIAKNDKTGKEEVLQGNITLIR